MSEQPEPYNTESIEAVMTWTYSDDQWQLCVPGHDAPIYAIGSKRQPTYRETLGIIQRLYRYYPWLRAAAMGRAA